MKFKSNKYVFKRIVSNQLAILRMYECIVYFHTSSLIEIIHTILRLRIRRERNKNVESSRVDWATRRANVASRAACTYLPTSMTRVNEIVRFRSRAIRMNESIVLFELFKINYSNYPSLYWITLSNAQCTEVGNLIGLWSNVNVKLKMCW